MAITDENTLVMPVAPMGTANNGGGLFGGCGGDSWLGILFLIALLGGGWGGLGGFGGYGAMMGMGMMDGRTSHGRMYYPRYYSYAKRDGRGRYSRDGYSYADAKSDMIAELKELAKKAPDDKTKQEIEHFANEMESK